MKRFILLLASWGGTGYSPVAPGTVGTLAAIPFYLVLSRLSTPLYLVTLSAFIVLAVWVSFGAELALGKKDPGTIVIDEVAGYLVTMTALPVSWQSVVAGFFLFRLFDIVKVPPARFFDQAVKNGWGVVLDDVVAGAYACLVLHLLARFL